MRYARPLRTYSDVGGGVTESTSDEILMAAYQAGNQAAFSELFERHAGSVYGFLFRRLGDRSLAEDLYQEAFLRLHRASKSYDPKQPFRAWLFAIVHNLLNDVLRERRRRPESQELDAREKRAQQEVSGAESPEELESGEPSPEVRASAREAARALTTALRELPAEEATVLILARLEGLSYDEIASVIGRSAAATKQLAYRALRRVRAEMTSAGHGEEP
jgi:RNA polymerase sigma factor (sigma-70 family)